MNLHDLIEDAVADVEPTDRLAELRARTASPARAAARPWWWAAGVTVVATAAAVTVVAVLDDDPVGSGHDHHHMATQPPAATQLVPAYFWGMAPAGTSLFREFDQVPAGDPLQAALDRLQQPPDDPDYHSAFPPGSFTSVSLGDSTIQVQVGGPEVATSGVAVQQVVFTLQAAAGKTWPVEFIRSGEVVGRPVTARPAVLNPVSISDPAEGNEYAGSMIARGRADVAGRKVAWEVHDPSGESVREGLASTSEGGGFRPWEVTVDLDGLAPGTYTFVAAALDPSGGAELDALDHDTRTIVVR